jgi:septum site-determining protein MinD
MMSIDDVLEILSIPLLGIVPESQEVLQASNVGSPVTVNAPMSFAARAYRDAAKRLNGEDVEMMMPSGKKSLLDRLLGRRAA